MGKRPVGDDAAALEVLQALGGLDAEHAQGVIDHRKKLRAPLTAFAAKLLAKQFALDRDPNGGAERMIVNGWRGFEPHWGAGRAMTQMQMTHGVDALEQDLRRRINDEQQGRAGQGSDDTQAFQGLPLLGWQGGPKPH